MPGLRTLLSSFLVCALACGQEGQGDDLPPGAFTSGTDDGLDTGSTSLDPTLPTGTDDGTTVTEGSTGEPIMYSHDQHILPLWTEHCSSDNACHDADAPANGLDLASEGVYTRICEGFHGLSGMPYIDCEGLDPQNSYVFRKIEGTHLSINGASGGPMPPVDSLSDSQVALIEAWITEGALQ